MNQLFLKISLGMCLCIILSTAQATKVYRWTDAEGAVHFSNKPPLKQQAELLFTTKTKHKPKTDNNRKRGTVKHVIDGDTLELTSGIKIRLAGINAPEVANRGKPGAPGGEAAKTYLMSLVNKKVIKWEKAEDPKDRYGRYLAHVYDENGTNVNQRLLQEGLVHVAIFPPNLNHIPEYLATEKTARQSRLGIWASPEYREFRSVEMTDARNHFRRVRLLVKEMEQSGRDTLLTTEDGFTLLINRKNTPSFEPLTDFLGSELLVRGWVKMRKKQLYIELKSPLQIEEKILKTP